MPEIIVKSIVSLVRYSDGTEVFKEPAYLRTADDEEFWTPGNEPEAQMIEASVTLDNEEIKALPSNPFVIIPATETLGYSGTPTTIPVPVWATGILKAESGAYANVHIDALFLLVYGSDWSDDCSHRNYVRDKLVAAKVSLLRMQFPRFFGTDTTHNNDLSIDNIFLSDNLEDNALAIACSNSLGPFTQGHADNTLTIKVGYTLLTL